MRAKSGYTLMEMMVALSCASVLLLVIWGAFDRFWAQSRKMLQGYSTHTEEILDRLSNMKDDFRNARKYENVKARFE